MSLEDDLYSVQTGGYVDYNDDAQIPTAVSHLLESLVREVDALRASTSADTGSSTITRTEALAMAREHVEAMSTNTRGYQDGVKLSDKVHAMDAFARFLMGETA
ncbi:hypothetical protein [Streptomyces niveus]|uniref:hypothetical protein n=1 Tax=Streptomyces niveus TaxID=193462 RepID=UPI0036469437